MIRLLPLQLLLLAALAPLLSAQDSSSCPCTFRGTVVDSVTGSPVRGALVQSSTGSPNATLTDSEGSFHFDGVPAGAIGISATKPGYLSGNPIPGLVSTFQVASVAASAVIKLTPAGVLAGRVVDDRGEPLENFRIQLVRRIPNDAQPLLVTNQQTLTNDLGKFRVPDLPSGSYFLLVAPSDQRGYRAPEQPVPLGYPAEYYPGVLDPSSASPIKILAGRETQANLIMAAKPFIRLSGTVSGYSSGSPVQLSLNSLANPSGPAKISFDPRTGFFQSDWIPPGQYWLDGEMSEPQSPGQPDTTRTAQQSVFAASSVTNLQLVLSPKLNITVKLRGLSQEDEANRVIIYAHEKGKGSGMQAFASRDPRDPGHPNDVYLFSLVPGTYALEVYPYAVGAYYVESISFGTTDLLAHDLVVDSSSAASTIEIVLRQGAATLSGKVVSKDSSHGAVICLFPPSPRAVRFFQQADADGSFHFDHLAPGSYRIAAVDGLLDLDSSDQELLAKISSHAREFSLVPEQSLSLTLDLTPVEE